MPDGARDSSTPNSRPREAGSWSRRMWAIHSRSTPTTCGAPCFAANAARWLAWPTIPSSRDSIDALTADALGRTARFRERDGDRGQVDRYCRLIHRALSAVVGRARHRGLTEAPGRLDLDARRGCACLVDHRHRCDRDPRADAVDAHA